LHTQNLSNELNANFATFDAQQSNYEFCDTEKALRSQIEDLKREEMQCNQTFLEDATFGKEYKTERVAINVSLEEGRIRPLSNHFSTLCFDVDVSSESSDLMENCIDEEQGPYILRFFSSRRQMNIPHIWAKKCKM